MLDRSANDGSTPVTKDFDVHVSGLGAGGGTLVVVAFGANVYGASDVEPIVALHAAASKAAEGLAQRGLTVDPKAIVERGEEELRARASRSSCGESRRPLPSR
jgi:hypothetical protein